MLDKGRCQAFLRSNITRIVPFVASFLTLIEFQHDLVTPPAGGRADRGWELSDAAARAALLTAKGEDGTGALPWAWAPSL